MPLRDLEYQARVLTRFDEYLTELAAQKAKADKITAANSGETDPDLIRPVPNFPATDLAGAERGRQAPAEPGQGAVLAPRRRHGAPGPQCGLQGADGRR